MDQHARELIQNDLDTTYLVEAGAGTGKTTLLVARILNLIRSGRATLPQIVAITFTEKAAEELKTRIKKQLQQQLDSEKNASILQRIRNAYLDIEKSSINTIHGFCASILKQYAIEAGLSPEFSVADPGAFHKFTQQLWQRWLIEQVQQQNPCLYSLLLLGISFEKLEKIVQLLIHQRDMPHVAKVDADVAHFQQELARITHDLQTEQQYCTNKEDKGYVAIETLKDQHIFLRQQPLEQFAYYVAHGIEVKSGGNQKNWDPPQVLKEVKQQLKSLKTLSETTRAHHNHNLVCDTIAWLNKFFDTVKQQKQTQALVDFDDLLYYVKHLLQTNQEIRRQCQENFRYILVDEFQDTNDLQVEILFQLASQDEELHDWQQAQLIPGKLFMVGDPKQSIYRFRGADIEIYETVKEILGSQHCLFITRNFRSTHGIIHWCNQVFSRLIVKPEDGKYQPQYTALSPSREGAQIANPIILVSYDLGDERPIEQEAKCVAESIRQIIDEKWTISKDGREQIVSYKDIAVLFRRYTYVNLFEQVLSSSNIPYQVIGGKSSFNRIEVHSLLSLLKTLVNPDDKMSLIATLRSPIFCISDREILQYSQQGLNYLAKPQTSGRMAVAMTLLREFHLQLPQKSGYQWLQNLYQKTHILLTFASMQQGKHYVKTLQKILNFAKVTTLNSFIDWKNFILWLSELDSLDNESQVEEDAISIFSIHRSKGLEFPVVIIADVSANIRELPYIIHDKPTNSVAIRLQRGLLETQNYSIICEKEKNRLVAEEKRLLYVAATRARDYLLVPVSGKKQGFLHFLHQDISAAETNIHVDTFHSIVKDVTLTSMEPVKIKNLDPVSESKWFSHRQRFLSQKKSTPLLERTIDTRHYKGLQMAGEMRDLLCMIFANDDNAFLHEKLKSFYFIKSFHLEKILSHLQNLDERIKLSKKKYHNLPFTFRFEDYLVMGNIDIAFQENDGFVMMDCNLTKKHDDEHYLYLGTIYSFAVSQLLNCMLKEITFYFIEEDSSYHITNVDFENMNIILDDMAKKYS
ncbi:UvrD-helicase domain-containing protein [Candidatus Uabimicrobium amorphum]|uniref:DNA 3'-5' helicase n=1 Tax=Uabimicrobium amorphum TaxID=2596890 RepID=A0A5S9IVD8_UABAM|nr:UvrD-helicase domain-containing protein [Candidatus Uabimicrobium amorphum]BBM87810.1 DNA helicase [Candidatus Uabimicrobium amorphum]